VEDTLELSVSLYNENGTEGENISRQIIINGKPDIQILLKDEMRGYTNIYVNRKVAFGFVQGTGSEESDSSLISNEWSKKWMVADNEIDPENYMFPTGTNDSTKVSLVYTHSNNKQAKLEYSKNIMALDHGMNITASSSPGFVKITWEKPQIFSQGKKIQGICRYKNNSETDYQVAPVSYSEEGFVAYLYKDDLENSQSDDYPKFQIGAKWDDDEYVIDTLGFLPLDYPIFPIEEYCYTGDLEIGNITLHFPVNPFESESITDEHKGKVIMRTRLGTSRIVDMLSGELLPRIC